MDDVADNVIPLERRRLLWEELRNAVEWLDDLDSPLTAERQEHTWPPLVTASERIRRARAGRSAFNDGFPAPPGSAA